MTPFLNQDDLVLGKERELLVGGKIQCLDPVSSNPIDIYTYDSSDDSYTVAENPIYLDVTSRPLHTYFSDQLVLCRLYKYIGDFSDPMIPGDDTENFEFVRQWIAGEDAMSDFSNKTVVYGLGGLKEADPELGVVTVVGYWNDHDCEAREYYWSESSTLTEDGGYVVKNDTVDTGRWILKFDGEFLPSTYYGVYPGHEENFNSLLGYVESIDGMRTAPGVYIKNGSYTASTSPLVTDKRVLMDAGTQFTRNYFDVRTITVVGEATDYICDFYVSDSSCPVHSGWYKTTNAFWMSGSRQLYIDKENYQTNTAIDSSITVQRATIYGTNRVPATYTTYFIKFERCDILGEGIFDNTDQVQFSGMDLKQSWISSNASQIDFLSKTLFRTAGTLNTLRLDNFKDASAYVKAVEADGQTSIDMAGRFMSSFSSSVITDIRNLVCTNLTLSQANHNVTLRNVTSSSAMITAFNLTVEDSSILFSTEPTLSGLYAFRSTITFQFPVTSKTMMMSMSDCQFNGAINSATDNTSDEAGRVFIDCTFSTNCSFKAKRLTMSGCTTSNCYIEVYPWKDDDGYHNFVRLENNALSLAAPVKFTKFSEDACYEIAANWYIVGNTFSGNADGLECRYWSNRTGSYYDKPFIKNDTDSVIEYHGNVGNCPNENMKGAAIPASTPVWRQVGDIYLYTYANDKVMPKYNYAPSASTNNKLYNVGTQNPNTFALFTDGTDVSMATGIFFWHTGSAFDDRDGSLFNLGICRWTAGIGNKGVKIV